MKSFRYYFFLVLHIVLLIAWYTSPFYLDWRIVILTVVLYHFQLYYAKGCLITQGQFGKQNEGFYYHYLTKFGFHPDKKKLSFVLDYIIPGMMIVLAITLQVVLK
ncbi:hypothetical protein KGM48_02620 [Patescibacteria group bacterium]|nr:hypothetical protein [Patescibacteria group bacterium]